MTCEINSTVITENKKAIQILHIGSFDTEITPIVVITWTLKY